MPDAAAGGGEVAEEGLAGEAAVERDEFAHLVARRVAVGALDGRQLEGKEDLGLVIAEELAERGQVMHRRQAQRGGNRAERDEAVRRSRVARPGDASRPATRLRRSAPIVFD